MRPLLDTITVHALTEVVDPFALYGLTPAQLAPLCAEVAEAHARRQGGPLDPARVVAFVLNCCDHLWQSAHAAQWRRGAPNHRPFDCYTVASLEVRDSLRLVGMPRRQSARWAAALAMHVAVDVGDRTRRRRHEAAAIDDMTAQIKGVKWELSRKRTKRVWDKAVPRLQDAMWRALPEAARRTGRRYADMRLGELAAELRRLQRDLRLARRYHAHLASDRGIPKATSLETRPGRPGSRIII